MDRYQADFARTVVIIGIGDMGERLAAGLAAGGRVHRLVLAGRSPAVTTVAATLTSASDCLVEPCRLDASRAEQVANLIDRTRPDLIVHCAAVRGPWALTGRDDPAAQAVVSAGLALRLPYQLPLLLTVMRAAQGVGYDGPIANLSFPDVTGPVLRRLGLAPTLGLGNAGMILRRVRAALRAAEPHADVPLVRIVAHHSQVFDVMQARAPIDPDERCHVHLGEDGGRADELAYRAPALSPGLRYNVVTAAAALPVLEALLPGSPPLRWSVPAPGGRPGGYPVHIADGTVALDLPPGLTPESAIHFNEHMARGDGVEHIEDDGTVHFTPASCAAVAGICPDLAAPLTIDTLTERAALLDRILGLEETLARGPLPGSLRRGVEG
jgi:hypothetical protein